MRQAPFSLVDKGSSCRINAWASVFMNNSCPLLLKKITPLPDMLSDCFRLLSGVAIATCICSPIVAPLVFVVPMR